MQSLLTHCTGASAYTVCGLVSDSTRRSLRLADVSTCVVPPTLSSYGDGTSAAAGPRLWNSLPVQLRNPDITYGLFRRQLKGHLFREARTRRSVTSDMRRHRKTLTYLLAGIVPATAKYTRLHTCGADTSTWSSWSGRSFESPLDGPCTALSLDTWEPVWSLQACISSGACLSNRSSHSSRARRTLRT